MKKIPSLLLVWILLMQLCVFSVSAAEADEQIHVLGIDATTTSATLQKEPDRGRILFTTSHWGGYKVNLPKAVSSIIVDYNTGLGSLGLLEIHKDSATGPLLGAINTTETASAWGDYTNVISFEEPLQGEVEIYVKSASGAHWFRGLTFVPDDPTQTFAKIKEIDNFKDIAEDTNRLEINILSDLGLIEAAEYFYPERPATRSEFVGMIGKLIGAENFAGSISPFADITLEDSNAKALSGLFSLGIIRGGTDGKFRPNDFITFNEAAAVCANALGYDISSSNMSVVFDHINSLKIFKGVATDDPHMTKSEAVKIIYNLLLADYLVPTDISANAVVYNPSKNFLEKNSQFVHAKGRVTANTVTELYAAKKDTGIRIDGEYFNVENIRNADYLGMICEYFYKVEDGEKVLYSLRPAAKTSYLEVVSGHNVKFDEISERELKFTLLDEDEEYEYELEAATSIIYNGTALSKSLATLVDPDTFVGKITIIDNNRDDVIDCLWIDKVDQIIKVDSVVDGKIKDQFTKKLYDTNANNFKLFIGERCAMVAELAKNDVITIYNSSDSGKNKLVRAKLSRKTLSGKITGRDSAGRYIIEDNLYSVADVCDDELYIGLNAKFYLDEYDRIVAAEKIEQFPIQIGAFIQSYLEDRILEEKVSLKLLTETGMQIYEVAEKVVADGVTVKETEEFFNGKGLYSGIANLEARTPVLYRLNENNQIVMLDTVNVGTNGIDDDLTKIYEDTSVYCYSNILTKYDSGYVQLHPVSPTAKNIVFTLDEKPENFKISTGFSTGDTPIPVVAYTTKKGSLIADIIVTSGDKRYTDKADVPFIFESKIKAINEDDEPAEYLVGYTTNGTKQIEVDAEIYNENETFKNIIDNLSEGDLVWPSLTNDKVTGLQITFAPGAGEQNANGLETSIKPGTNRVSMSGAGAVHYGEVEKIEGTFVKIKYLSDGDAHGGFRSFYCASARVVICTKEADGKFTYTAGQGIDSMVEGDRILALIPRTAEATAIFVYRGDLSE